MIIAQDLLIFCYVELVLLGWLGPRSQSGVAFAGINLMLIHVANEWIAEAAIDIPSRCVMGSGGVEDVDV